MQQKIKIAFLMQESRMGGIEYNSVQLAGALNPVKFEVIFFCPSEGKLTEMLKAKGLRFILYSRPQFYSTSFRFLNRTSANPFALVWNFLTFPGIALSLARRL